MSQSKPHSAAKAVSLTAIITFASQCFGFVREIILAAAFGTNIQMDAYNMALGLIYVLPIILLSYTSATYIPEYTKARNESEYEASRYYSLILTINFSISVVINVIVIAFAPCFVGMFAPGFMGETKNLTIFILRVLSLIIPLNIAVSVWNSTLNARKSHVIPILAGASVNLFVIPAALLFSKHVGIWALIVSTILNSAFQCVVLYTSVVRQKQYFRPTINLKEPRLIKTVKLALPTVATSAILQLNELVDRTISSGLPEGTVSAYSYGLRLCYFVPNIILTPFITVLFTRMSECAANNDKHSSLDIMRRTTEVLLSVALPVCVITLFMRSEIVRIAFERGAFGEKSTDTVGLVLMFYIWIMVIIAVSAPLSNAFLAWQDMRGMVLRGVIAVAVNVVTSIILSRYWGIVGIVIGTLLSNAANALILLITLRHRWGPLGILRTVIEGLKMLVCASACGLLSYILRGILPASNGTVFMDLFRFGTVTFVGGGVFYLLALLLRVRSVKEVLGLVIAKVKSVLPIH